MASIKLRGDTSGELVIEAPAVAGTNTLTLPASTSTLATTAQTEAIYNSLGVRNLIINGDMRIAQRATSVTGKVTGDYDTVDRFIYINSGETITEEQSTDVPTGQGFSNSFKATITTANTPTGTQQAYIATRLEGQNLQHLKFGTSSAENLTLSFWIKTNFTDQITLWLWNPDANRHIAYALNVDSANTWQKVTWSIDGDTAGAINNDNGVGLQLRWILSTGSDFQGGTLDTSWAAITTAGRYQGQGNFTGTTSNYINITGVQLEVGDTATPFEHRPYDMELRRCLRYYYKNIGNGAGTGPYGMGHCRSNYLRGQIWLPVTMRATPTMTNTGTDADYIVTSGTSDFTSFVTRPSLDGGGPDGLNFRVQVSSGMTNGYAALLSLNSSNSYLEFSAEL